MNTTGKMVLVATLLGVAPAAAQVGGAVSVEAEVRPTILLRPQVTAKMAIRVEPVLAVGPGVTVRIPVAVPVDVRVGVLAGVEAGVPDSGEDEPVSQNERQEKEKEKQKEAAERQREREAALYERGSQALDEKKWDRAVEAFQRVADAGGARADGALYWLAYAHFKAGHVPEALSTIEALTRSHPQSRWLGDARALEIEVRRRVGQPVSPEGETDDDLKLMALNGLMNADPARAVPILEQFLQGSHSPKLKERALFVLAQSGSAQAREVLAKVARGGSNPDLQRKALQYLGLFGGRESRQVLAEIYASTQDVSTKKTILHSFMVGGDRERLLAAARGEADPDLRAYAIQQLGVMGAQAELWQLYQAEASLEMKKKILHGFFLGGNVEKLIEIARGEKDLQLRRSAIHNLGISGGKRTGDALVGLYADPDAAIKKDVVQALFIQGNAKALVELARKETDAELRKQLIQKLSVLGSKEATDFLMELLNK